jgi:hypothetical protein
VPKSQISSVVLEDVKILFRNFQGKEGKYNREGDRNFAVLLDDATANAMSDDGWAVKWLAPREEGEDPRGYLSVAVKFGQRPPRIVMISDHGRTHLGESEVELLDHADILSCDMIIRPYEWVIGGKTGVKAYLQSLFVNIESDPLERKYAEYNH